MPYYDQNQWDPNELYESPDSIYHTSTNSNDIHDIHDITTLGGDIDLVPHLNHEQQHDSNVHHQFDPVYGAHNDSVQEHDHLHKAQEHTSVTNSHISDHPGIIEGTEMSEGPLYDTEQFFSPALSFQGTPLMSPHALAPQSTQSLSFQSRLRTSSQGKVIKESPSRWKSNPVPEFEDLGDFDLGDPAMSVYDGNSPQNQTGTPTQDVEDKLKAAIMATTNAQPRRTSTSSVLSRRTSNASSRAGSRSTTPRIRPRLSASDIESDDSFARSYNMEGSSTPFLGIPKSDRISTGLNAKKNVHKIAEKERRNRMNQAIIELTSVMGPVSDANSITMSKAATVERATAYIKQLKQTIKQLEENQNTSK